MAIKGSEKKWADMDEIQLKRRYLSPGEYVLKIVSVAEGVDGKSREFYAADFEVVSTTSPEFAEGDSVSVIFFAGKYPQYYKRDIKGLLAAAAPETTDYKTLVMAAPSDEQPLAGRLLVCNSYEDTGKINPKNGKGYTRNEFVSLADAGLDEQGRPASAA
jgi:hypothetical protein